MYIKINANLVVKYLHLGHLGPCRVLPLNQRQTETFVFTLEVIHQDTEQKKKDAYILVDVKPLVMLILA